MIRILNVKNMLLVTSKFLKLSAVVLLMLATAACGGKNLFNKGQASAEKQESAQSSDDITRPPEVEKGARQEQAPGPDETVSYEKWKQEQDSDNEDE